jgi:hypothetical protein
MNNMADDPEPFAEAHGVIVGPLTAVTHKLDRLPAEARTQVLGALKTIQVDPILADRTWSPERADEALMAISTVAVRLAQVLGVPVPPHSQPLALELVPLP